MGEQVNLGLVLAEVEWLRFGVAKRKGVPEPVGEAREVVGRVGRWRQQVDGVGTYLSSGWGLLVGLDSAVSDGLQRLGS